jgi:hypothetical protein
MLCGRQRLVLKFVKCPVAAGKEAGRDKARRRRLGA